MLEKQEKGNSQLFVILSQLGNKLMITASRFLDESQSKCDFNNHWNV